MKKLVKCTTCNKEIQNTAQVCRFCKSTRQPQYVDNAHINSQISLILSLIESETSFDAVAIKLNDSGNERIDNRSWTTKDIRDVYEGFVGQFNFKNGKWRPCPSCSEAIEIYTSSCHFCKSKVNKIYTKNPFANRQVAKIIDLSKSLTEIEVVEQLKREGENRIDGREWRPSDIVGIKKEFQKPSRNSNKSDLQAYWLMTALLTAAILVLAIFYVSLPSTISYTPDFPQQTKASQSRYNQNMFLATTSENLTNADLAWHATNTYGWNCSEVTAKSTSNGSYYTITCSNGRQLRVYPRAGQHPRITNAAGNYH